MCKWKYTNSTNTDLPTFICWLLLFAELWAECIRPSVTYGLCMPSAFRMIAERTSDEFSIRAGRWGSRLAFLRSVSKSQVNRVPLSNPYPQRLVNWTMWLLESSSWTCSSKISFMDVHEESQIHVKMGKGQNCSCSHIKTIKAHPYVYLWLPRNWPMTNEAY